MLRDPQRVCRAPLPSHHFLMPPEHLYMAGFPTPALQGPLWKDLPWWGLASGFLPKWVVAGGRLRELRGVVRAWPCSFSFTRLPALVPLTTAPLSLPLAGGARGYRGGKLGPEGGERAPAAGRAEGAVWGSEPEERGQGLTAAAVRSQKAPSPVPWGQRLPQGAHRSAGCRTDHSSA